jgi:hypothetical protein
MYYRDNEGSLFRERDGWGGEILNGDEWQFYAIDMTRVVTIDEAEAEEMAAGTPLDAENQGISVAAGISADQYAEETPGEKPEEEQSAV